MFQPGDSIAQYEVLERLGEGGMASVFKARHVFGHVVALKVLNPDLVRDDDLRQRFLSEGRVQSSLKHPNIVAVTDVLAVPGVAALVMEYIDGVSLEDVIASRPAGSPLPSVENVRTIFLPLIDALSFVHKQGIVHRDIKPANILLAFCPDGGVVPKILDFGIAKVPETFKHAARPTRVGARIGTPHYMSPEQVQGLPDLDARSDIFSLASTLYEFVSGRSPFDRDSEYATMKAVVEDDPPPLTGVDPDLAACVFRGLEKSRERRFKSCAEFAAQMSMRRRPVRQTAVLSPPVAMQIGASSSERGPSRPETTVEYRRSAAERAIQGQSDSPALSLSDPLNTKQEGKGCAAGCLGFLLGVPSFFACFWGLWLAFFGGEFADGMIVAGVAMAVLIVATHLMDDGQKSPTTESPTK